MFSVDKNEAVLAAAEGHCTDRRWGPLVQLWQNSIETALRKLRQSEAPEPTAVGRTKKRRRPSTQAIGGDAMQDVLPPEVGKFLFL